MMADLLEYLFKDSGEKRLHQFRRVELHYSGEEIDDGHQVWWFHIAQIVVAGMAHQFTAGLIHKDMHNITPR